MFFLSFFFFPPPNGKGTGFFSHSQPEGIFLKLSIEILLWADTKHGHFPTREQHAAELQPSEKRGLGGNDGRIALPYGPLPSSQRDRLASVGYPSKEL